jgi:hypothetical protein
MQDASTNYIIKFENNNNPILAYKKVNDSIINEKTFYSKPTPEMKDAPETETNQPGGKRRSRKKRNMKKSKKGKSKNRR